MRRDWANECRGKALVVYGHTPVATSEFGNNTINIDQVITFNAFSLNLSWSCQ